MKKFFASSAAAIVLVLTVGSADASDFEPDKQLELIVSGVVDSWAGVQIVDEQDFGSETVFATGGEGLLSLPLGENLSIQSDVKYETNDRAFRSQRFADPIGPRYSYQGAVHLSWRDPMSGLFGIFGGAGSNSSNLFPKTDTRFVGGEGQIYLDNITVYVQGGYVEFESALEFAGLEDGLFARGVVRWFLGNDNRVQLEGTYLNAGFNDATHKMDAFSLEARYDFTLMGMPIVGDVPLYIAYRGTFRDACLVGSDDPNDVNDHAIMIGMSYSFSGDRLTVDRQGTTLDTPDFNHSCGGSFGSSVVSDIL